MQITKATPICIACGNQHITQKCEKFKKLSPNERSKMIRSSGACINCLHPLHKRSECKSMFKMSKESSYTPTFWKINNRWGNHMHVNSIQQRHRSIGNSNHKVLWPKRHRLCDESHDRSMKSSINHNRTSGTTTTTETKTTTYANQGCGRSDGRYSSPIHQHVLQLKPFKRNQNPSKYHHYEKNHAEITQKNDQHQQQLASSE